MAFFQGVATARPASKALVKRGSEFMAFFRGSLDRVRNNCIIKHGPEFMAFLGVF